MKGGGDDIETHLDTVWFTTHNTTVLVATAVSSSNPLAGAVADDLFRQPLAYLSSFLPSFLPSVLPFFLSYQERDNIGEKSI